MYNKIRDHVEFLFQGAPANARSVELKEEMISSLMDRYSDLIAQGETEEAAYGIVIGSIGDVDELIRSLREQSVWDSADMQAERRRSALFVSVAVGLFVFSPVFLILADTLWGTFLGPVFNVLGPVLTLLFVAVGAGLLVYNARTRVKYPKPAAFAPEDDKHTQKRTNDSGVAQAVHQFSKKQDNRAFSNTIQGIIYTATVPLYLILGLFLDAWHPGWLVFLIAPCAAQVVRLVLLYQEEE